MSFIRKMTMLLLGMVIMLSAVQSGFSYTPGGMKKRIAVFEFDDKTDHKVRWWNGQSPGRGMADMLITELVKSGKYTVIERTAIEKVLKEQQLGASGLVTPQTAAEMGKLLGVEIAVLGTVTEFGHAKSKVGGTFKNVGLGVSSQDVTVAVDVRLVDTTTGEILSAENVRKSKSKKGLSFRKESMSFNNQNKFDESLVGKATRDAINNIVEIIAKNAASIKWQGAVIKADGSGVIINAGSDAGITVGDQLTIYRKGEALIDPETGLNLGSEEEMVGIVEVTSNSIGGGKASKCKVISGTGFDRGNIVRRK